MIISTGKTGIQSIIMYKGNFFMSLLIGLVSLYVQIIFWPAVYGVDLSKISSYNGATISGYTLGQMLAYSVMVYMLQYGNSAINIGNIIKNDVMSGNLNTSLIRPYNYLFYRVILNLSHQIISFTLSAFTAFVLIWLSREWIALPDSIINILLLIPAAFISYAISFLISCILGLISFWILETSTLHVFLNGIMMIMSGSVFPLDFVSGSGGVILRFLPFSYITFFPIQLYLSNNIDNKIFFDFIVGIIWIVILVLIVKSMWNKGLRRYSAYGG